MNLLPNRTKSNGPRRGAAMLMVLIALIFATTLGVTFLVTQGPSTAIGQNVRDHARARLIAETGLTTAIAYVRESDDWRTAQSDGYWLADQDFEGGQFRVIFEDEDGDLADDHDDPVTITVIGRFGGVSHRVRAVVTTSDPSGTKFEVGTAVIGATPTGVSLVNTYDSPVVVCTPNYTNNSIPIVVRISGVGTKSFSAYLQNPSGDAVSSETVSYMVMEEGAYEVNGFKFEAQKYTSTITAEKNKWVAEEQAYLQSYSDPVVIGQVMSTNDPAWSVFWCQGNWRGSPPSATTIRTGKMVAEDSNTTRADEVVGFIVWEAGGGSISDTQIDAELSSDSIRGMANNPPHSAVFGTSFATEPTVVLASVAGMDGGDGGWAVTYGSPFASASIARVAVDEDQINDKERHHTTEQLGVIAFEAPMAYPADAGSDANLIALYEFNEVPIMPGLVGHWKLDETASNGGGAAMGDRLYMYNNALIDGYDSSAGAYGGDNVLTGMPIGTNATGDNEVQMFSQATIRGDLYVGPGADPDDVVQMYNQAAITGARSALPDPLDLTVPEAPGDIPKYKGNGQQTYNGGDHVWDSDRSFARLTLNNGATVTVQGHVRVAVNAQITLNSGTIIVPEGSSLELYAGVSVTLNNDSAINPDSSDPGRLSLYVHGNGSSRDMTMNSQSVVSGRVHVADDLTLNNQAAIYGSVLVGDDLTMHSQSAIHLDQMQPNLVRGVSVHDSTDRENDGFLTAGQVGLPGKLGRSYRFDGEDDYAVIPHHDAYLLDAGALSMWFRTEDKHKDQSVFSKDHLNLGTGGHLTVLIDDGAVKTRLQSTSQTWNLTAAAPIQNDTWHHMVFTWGPNKMRLYLDGQEIGDPFNYIGGTGDTSGGAGNFEPIVLGADTRWSDPGQPTPIKDFFRGQIDDVRIYDQALDANQVENLAVGSDPGPSSFPGYLVEDTSGFGDPLHLTVQDTDAIAWPDGGGLLFTDDTLALSNDPATKLYNAIAATGSFTLEAVFTPDNLAQNGPARILSYSQSTSSRNFTLGQDGDAYAFRLRTTDTGSNGTPDITSPDDLDAAEQHVVITANGQTVNLYRNGDLEHTEDRAGTFNWDDAMRLMMGGEADDSRNWRGLLSRIAIYDRALAPSQVDNLFNGLPPGDATGNGGFKVIWTEEP